MRKHLRQVKWWPAVVLACILVVTLAAGIAVAATSPSYNLTPNSLAAVGTGGGIAKSTSYVLVVSIGGIVETSSTSASYDLCSGFVCGGGDPFFHVRLPYVGNNPP